MNNNKFNKGIEDIKKISMSSKEKELMYNSIMIAVPAPEISANSSIRSPWTIYSFNMWITKHRWSYAVILLLVISLAGGSAVSAASTSLPGDILYPVKVNISEPVRIAFAGSAKVKAQLAVDFADERMKEGEILASEGKLDEVKQKELSDRVIGHTQELNIALLSVDSFSDDSHGKDGDDIRDSFKKRMNKHADRLDEIAQNSNNESNIKDNEDNSSVRIMKVKSAQPQSAMLSEPATSEIPEVVPTSSKDQKDSDVSISYTVVNRSDRKMKNREDNPIFKLAESARMSRDEAGNSRR